MFADKRASAVGDIVTILVQENSSATKDNTTTTSKHSSINSAIASFLYSPAASGLLTKDGTLPALKLHRQERLHRRRQDQQLAAHRRQCGRPRRGRAAQ